MAFFCQPCRDLMESPGFGVGPWRGYCECCGDTDTVTEDVHGYQFAADTRDRAMALKQSRLAGADDAKGNADEG